MVEVTEALHRLVEAHVVCTLIQPVVLLIHAGNRVLLLDLERGRQRRRRCLLLTHHLLYSVEALVSGMLHSLILVALHMKLLCRRHHIWKYWLVLVASCFVHLHLLVRHFVMHSL